MTVQYYKAFEDRRPPQPRTLSPLRQGLWQFLASWMLGLAAWYFLWRWTQSLNPDAMVFSIVIATAETLFLVGMILYLYDTWSEPPLPEIVDPDPLKAGGRTVDVFITTYDEPYEMVEDSIRDARALIVPVGWSCRVHVLDDGDRPTFRHLADLHGAMYHRRDTNTGFKAGNLKNALLHTDGDFIVIADADTRLFPQFLQRTLGHFHDPTVAWVQTPHWFYDVPEPPKQRNWLQRTFGLGHDPFLVDPSLFFDVILRRRDRHGASFCCGAGSVHRREAICAAALADPSPAALGAGTQPFIFHVSEDIHTSIRLHAGAGGRWRSVYHPWVEARMLSPWSLDAWAAQKLKYAGGTFDIFLNHKAPWRRGMPWKIRMHYLTTIWSYLSVFPMLVLFFAPVFTLFTAIAPVAAYSSEFFIRLLPMAIMAELALMIGSKGYDIQAARTLNIATAPYVLRGFFQALTRRKIGFRPTPKTLKSGSEFRFVSWQIVALIVFGAAAVHGVGQYLSGNTAYTLGLLTVNGFWVLYNMSVLWRVVRLGSWQPDVSHSDAGGAEYV